MVGVVCCKQVSSYNSVDFGIGIEAFDAMFSGIRANSECHFLASERIQNIFDKY